MYMYTHTLLKYMYTNTLFKYMYTDTLFMYMYIHTHEHNTRERGRNVREDRSIYNMINNT